MVDKKWYPRNYYILKHRLTGKMYIGQRKSNDVGIKYFGSGKYWINHRKKYGYIDIDILEITYFLHKEDAKKWLQNQIEKYGEYWLREDFANLIPESTDNYANQLGNKHSIETKARMSKIRKGRQQFGGVTSHSEESKKKMSNSRKGRILSEEDKLKKSLALKGKPKTEQHKEAMRGVVKRKVGCPICDRIVGSHNLHRHLKSCENKGN